MRSQLLKGLLPACALMALAVSAGPARADLVLNAAGLSDGFSVTNFATGLPPVGAPFNFGPFGLAVANNGSGGTNVLVSDDNNGTLYVFHDTDGQTPASAIATHSSSSGVGGYGSLGGVAYGSQGAGYGSFNPNTGAFTPFSIPGLPGQFLGVAGDSVTGEIIAASNGGLIAINPITNTFRTINGGLFPDGVSISPDGQTVYVENGNIQGYNVHTGALGLNIGVPGGPDGTGVISSTNALNGDIIVNTNSGQVYLINPTTDTVTLIGTNANERGDYTAPDSTNGTLLMDFTDEVERLSCGAGCSIGSPPPTGVPEPASLALFGVGLVGFGFMRNRWAKK
jgi:hypothetical protein